MSDSAEVLLIILSAVLTVFLVILIVAAIYGILVLRRVKRITDRAEDVTESVKSAAAIFEKAATPLAIIKVINKIFTRHDKRKKE